MERKMIIITSRKFYRGGGIPVSTENLFKDEFKILYKKKVNDENGVDPSVDALSDEEIIAACEDYPEVLFSGYDVLEEKMLRTLKDQGKKIFLFWHFAPAVLTGEKIHIKNWISLTELAKEKYIDLLLTCKAGLDEMWRRIPVFRDIPILRLRNNVMDSSYKDIPKNKIAGVYSGSGDFWVKNSITNVSALAMHDVNMPVDITPLNETLKYYAESLGLKVTGVNTLPHDEFLKRMAACEFVMYVTMTEACPMLPLEAMMNGVLCLTGNNHDLFNSSSFLTNNLVVNRPDDPMAIWRQLESALKNKNDIFAEFEKCKEDWNALCNEDLDHFLNYDFESGKAYQKRK